MLKKSTAPGANGSPRFRDERPLFWRVTGKVRKEVLDSLAPYRETLAPERRHLFDMLRCIDVGFKVVGTGSVGLRDYLVLFEGNGPGDPLFLQVKEEVASAYAKYLPGASEKRSTGSRSGNQNEGRRAAEGERALQPMSDLLLGWTRIGSSDYLVRQLNDHKGGIDLRTLRGGGLRSLALVAGECCWRGGPRTIRRRMPDPRLLRFGRKDGESAGQFCHGLCRSDRERLPRVWSSHRSWQDKSRVVLQQKRGRASCAASFSLLKNAYACSNFLRNTAKANKPAPRST